MAFCDAQRLALPAAGEKENQKRKTVITQKQAQKRAESQSSGARFVRRMLLIDYFVNMQVDCPRFPFPIISLPSSHRTTLSRGI